MFINSKSYFGIEDAEINHIRSKIAPHWDNDKDLDNTTKGAAKYLMSDTDEPSIPKYILTKTSLEIIEKIKITGNTMAMVKPEKFGNTCWGHISTKDHMFRYMVLDNHLFVVHFYLYTDKEQQYKEALDIFEKRMQVTKENYPDLPMEDHDTVESFKHKWAQKALESGSARFIAYNVWCFTLGLDSKEYNLNEHHIKFLRIFVFMHYTTPETKIIPSGKKVGSKKHGYFNLSTNDVIVVDSNWNTTIIRTEGFSVDGHLRLQPCGKNHEDRKLIWIEPFEKEGYIRKAKNNV